MDDRTRRIERYEDEEDALRLDDVLEPYGQERQDLSPYGGEPQEDYAGEPYEEPYEGYEEPYGDPYAGEYSDYHEAVDDAIHQAGRFRVAMGVFDTVSILVGVGVILLLVAMLVSLLGWLRSDILHSALLLQSGLQ